MAQFGRAFYDFKSIVNRTKRNFPYKSAWVADDGHYHCSNVATITYGAYRVDAINLTTTINIGNTLTEENLKKI